MPCGSSDMRYLRRHPLLQNAIAAVSAMRERLLDAPADLATVNAFDKECRELVEAFSDLPSEVRVP